MATDVEQLLFYYILFYQVISDWGFT